MTDSQDSAEPPQHSDGIEVQAQALPKILRFEDLKPCGNEIWIENGGQIYRLRRTRQGKLILTK